MKDKNLEKKYINTLQENNFSAYYESLLDILRISHKEMEEILSNGRRWNYTRENESLTRSLVNKGVLRKYAENGETIYRIIPLIWWLRNRSITGGNLEELYP